MIRKRIKPIVELIDGEKKVVGALTEVYLFGIPIIRKVLHTPEKYGVTKGYDYQWLS